MKLMGINAVWICYSHPIDYMPTYHIKNINELNQDPQSIALVVHIHYSFIDVGVHLNFSPSRNIYLFFKKEIKGESLTCLIWE